ncbi:MAG TPA: cupin domain-containing protein [Pseudolabrys sp.]|nr:cupin domain-containing protein [Pseudolabrys sp.]
MTDSGLFGDTSLNLRTSMSIEQEETMAVEALRDPATEARKGHVMRGGAGYRAEQGSDYEPGVSAETTGSKSIWLGMISLPPGARTRAHVHERHETALYMLNGNEMELWTGDQLQYRDVVRPGDYIFIPANVLHVAVNRCAEPAVFIGSRNEATAQESVVLRPEMDARVP